MNSINFEDHDLSSIIRLCTSLDYVACDVYSMSDFFDCFWPKDALSLPIHIDIWTHRYPFGAAVNMLFPFPLDRLETLINMRLLDGCLDIYPNLTRIFPPWRGSPISARPIIHDIFGIHIAETTYSLSSIHRDCSRQLRNIVPTLMVANWHSTTPDFDADGQENYAVVREDLMNTDEHDDEEEDVQMDSELEGSAGGEGLTMSEWLEQDYVDSDRGSSEDDGQEAELDGESDSEDQDDMTEEEALSRFRALTRRQIPCIEYLQH